MKLGCRSIAQLSLSVTVLLTSVVGFIFILLYRDLLTVFSKNLTSDAPQRAYYPCIRQTLNTCSAAVSDVCYDKCCPVGYLCAVSPVVGLFCQHGDSNCEICSGSGCSDDFAWCRDLADISGQCLTEACKQHHTVLGMTLAAFVLAGVAVFLDFGDVVCYFIAPDSVMLKSGLNAVSLILKFAAIAGVIGTNSVPFSVDIGSKHCYVDQTTDAIVKAASHLVAFIATTGVSAVVGLVLAPVSAFWGGKLVGVPYIK